MLCEFCKFEMMDADFGAECPDCGSVWLNEEATRNPARIFTYRMFAAPMGSVQDPKYCIEGYDNVPEAIKKILVTEDYNCSLMKIFDPGEIKQKVVDILSNWPGGEGIFIFQFPILLASMRAVIGIVGIEGYNWMVTGNGLNAMFGELEIEITSNGRDLIILKKK